MNSYFKRQKLVDLVAIFFLVLFLVTMGTYVASVYTHQRAMLNHAYGRIATGLSRCVANMFSDKETLAHLEHYASTFEKDDKYDSFQKRVTEFRSASGASFCYIVVLENGRERYLIDSVTTPATTCELGEVERNAYPLATRLFATGQADPDEYEYSTKIYGPLVIGYSIIHGINGKPLAIVGTDFIMGDVYSRLNSFFLLSIVFSSLVLLAFLGISYWFFRSRVIQPIIELSDVMKSYAASEHDGAPQQYLAKIRADNEIGDLAGSYNLMILQLEDYIAEVSRSVKALARSEGELRAARTIQEGILPHRLAYKELPNIQVDAFLKPARDVGGDLYDVFVVNRDQLAVIIGDVSGKGVPAAMFMAVTEKLQRSLVQADITPAELAKQLNSVLYTDNAACMFVTWCVAFLDGASGRLNYCSAGHNPPMVRRHNGTVEILDGESGLPLTVSDDSRFETCGLELGSGDMLVLYTDGITEAMNEHSELFGEARLQKTLETSNAATPEEMSREIRRAVAEFASATEQSDDITLVVVQFVDKDTLHVSSR